MHLICKGVSGAPVAKVRSHPSRARCVSFSATKDEACLWGWESGDLTPLARFGSGRPYGDKRTIRLGDRECEYGKGRFIGDVAFHPGGEIMAVVGAGRPIEICRVSDGERLASIGDVSRPILVKYDEERNIPALIPPEEQGFECVAFSPGGNSIIAAALYEEGAFIVGSRNMVFDLKAGDLVGSFSRSAMCFATHPGRDLLAVMADDGSGLGTDIRFFRTGDPFQGAGQAAVPTWGTMGDVEPESFSHPAIIHGRGMAFSRAGDALALLWGLEFAREGSMSVFVYDFPSFEMRFEESIELGPWEDEAALDALHWLPIEHAAFDRDGRRLFVPFESGEVVAFDATSGREIERQRAHRRLASTLDIGDDGRVLLTGGFDGEVKVWRLDS